MCVRRTERAHTGREPIADNLEAAQGLTGAAEQAGVALLVGHHRRHNPIIRKARQIVQGGRLGQLTAVIAVWTLLKPDDYYDATWRREPGGGAVLTKLMHDIDNLRFVCGEIASLQAVTSNTAHGFVVDDTAAVILSFADGTLGR